MPTSWVKSEFRQAQCRRFWGGWIMQGYVVRRLLALIPTLIFASFIVFMTVRMIPGNIIDLMLSQNDSVLRSRRRLQLEMALASISRSYIQYFRGSARCCSTATSASRCGATPR